MKKERQETTAPTKKKKQQETEARSKAPLLDISKSKAMEVTAVIRGGYSFSVVNTDTNGKRVTLSKKLKKDLGDPKSIQVRTLNGKVLVGYNLDPDDRSYKFSVKATSTLYSAAIVNFVTETLELDYSEINPNTGNKITAITLTNIKIRKATNKKDEVIKVAVIRKNDK